MTKQLTKLEFYKKAKAHFTENKVGLVKTGKFPFALCHFLQSEMSYHNISERNSIAINYAIKVAKTKDWLKKVNIENKGYLNTGYFTSDASRMKFINSEIKRLTR